MRIKIVVFLSIFSCLIAVATEAYSFSVNKPVICFEFLNYTKRTGSIKFCRKEFANLARQKANLWNKFLFNVARRKLKHDLKKNSRSGVNNLWGSHTTGFLKVLFWVIIGIFALLGLFFIIYGFAPK